MRRLSAVLMSAALALGACKKDEQKPATPDTSKPASASAAPAAASAAAPAAGTPGKKESDDASAYLDKHGLPSMAGAEPPRD